MTRRLRVLHAIHDFLPRHRAGSEIYACHLAQEQVPRHDVFVLAAEYDPAARHGMLRWRAFDGLPVIEIVNNWAFDGFAESYRSARLNEQIGHALDAVQPDVVHVHNLLNLSFDLPQMARARGAAVVATLHDYTLVCPSGGQRVHVGEAHVCDEIDPVRCGRCFVESPLYGQMAAGRALSRPGGRLLGRGAVLLRRVAPSAAAAAGRALDAGPVTPEDVRRRLAGARALFDNIDLFVAPSPSLGQEFVRLGLDPRRLEVSDYGFRVPAQAGQRAPRAGRLRAGFVGTLVWHKGAHVLLEAAGRLRDIVEVHVHGDTGVFPDYSARLRALAAGLPVTFHGGFDPREAPRIYAGLDALVVPSLWPENSPLVIHEAFMHHVPVVGSRIGGIRDLVEHERSGLLTDPGSAESLVDALRRLAGEPGLQERLAAGAPVVKTIAADADAWDVRYTRLLRGNPASVA